MISQSASKMTEVVYQPAPGKPYTKPTITVKGQRLQVVDKFTYLESTLSRVVRIDDEVNARIAKASAAFGRLRGSIWDRSGIRLDTKLKVYRFVVQPKLLYACEIWTVYQRHSKRLNHFHASCLRKFLKIKWQDRIPDTEVLKKTGIQSVHTLLKLGQLRWKGHPSKHVYMGPIWAESGHLSHSGPAWAPYMLFCPYKTYIGPILVNFDQQTRIYGNHMGRFGAFIPFGVLLGPHIGFFAHIRPL